jgi:hypothetical protein
MNVPRFAIPGLFPVGSPNLESRNVANPDGSFSVMMWEQTYTGDAPTTFLDFIVMLSDMNQDIFLLDMDNERVVQEVLPGRVKYYYKYLPGEEQLPVGITRMDVIIKGSDFDTYKTFNITVNDSPFHSGAKSAYRSTAGGLPSPSPLPTINLYRGEMLEVVTTPYDQNGAVLELTPEWQIASLLVGLNSSQTYDLNPTVDENGMIFISFDTYVLPAGRYAFSYRITTPEGEDQFSSITRLVIKEPLTPPSPRE